MRKLLMVLVLLDLVLLANCGGGSSSSAPDSGGGPASLQSIQISPSGAAIAPGTMQAFTASGTYSDGSSKDLTLTVQWACLGCSSANISNLPPTKGVATALGAGTAVISASMGGVTNNSVLTINNVQPVSVVLSPATATIGWENQQQYTATATFSDSSQQDVTNVSSWSSSLPFTTSNSGLAIGQAVGMNTIFASFGSQNGNASLTVDLSNLTSISIVPANSTAAIHTKLQFAAIGTFVDGSTRDVTSLVTWSSSNTGVANFDSFVVNSLITCTAVGTTTITATVQVPNGSITGTTNFNVSGATLTSIALFPASASIGIGAKIAMTPIGIFSDSSTQNLTGLVTWSTNNFSSTSVDDTGTVTGLASGSSTITATSLASLGSVQGQTQGLINVTSATLSSIALTPANAFMTPGNTQTYAALGTFTDGSKQDMTAASSWGSNLLTIATVRAGVATGQGIGQAMVTVRSGSIHGVTGLMVASPQQISIAIAPSSAQVAQRTSIQLSAQGTFVGSTGAQDLTTAVNWTSSAPKVATVGWQTGIVTAFTPGQTTITATLGSVKDTIQVKVTDASLTSITLSPASSSIALGSSQQLTATGDFSDGSNEALVGATWSSPNPAIAVVNNSGLANSIGIGTARITATVNGVNGSTNLTVH
jgi:uncharacterized protein YjdB